MLQVSDTKMRGLTMLNNKDDLRSAVAHSIGLNTPEDLAEDFEWDSLDHLSVITNLGDKFGVDLMNVGDLSDANSLIALAEKLNLK